MLIETVKENGDGWLINGSVSVPNDPSNRHYTLIQDWIAAGNTPEPELNLDGLKKIKISELYLACSNHIIGGITSDALGGVTHTYPTTQIDQANLNGVVTESLVSTDPNWSAPFWCADANNNWDRRIHTRSEIQQLGQEVAAHVRDAQDRLKILVDQANDPLTDTTEKVNLIIF